MIAIILKVYVLYIHMQIKYESITYMLTTKKGGDAYISMKINSHFKIDFQNTNKTNTTKTNTKKERWDNRRKSFKLYNHNNLCILFPCLHSWPKKNQEQISIQGSKKCIVIQEIWAIFQFSCCKFSHLIKKSQYY